MKAHADHIVIAGFDGGTGASPQSSLQHAGVPWELGLAETQQTLVRNGLRSRVVLQADGGMRTGRDVVIAALLGAEEIGASTAPLIAMGCIMMRVCHLNTCPVGIATQDPVLRERFAGKPEHVIRFFTLLAEDVRVIMASLGVARFKDLVGRVDLLRVDRLDHWKAIGLDVTPLLGRGGDGDRRSRPVTIDLEAPLDYQLVEQLPVVRGEYPITNRDRTVGGLLSGEIVRRGIDADVRVTFRGSAGQSFGAWLAPGVDLTVIGDVNDYAGKGLSGGVITVHGVHDGDVVCGNTTLYGATSGRAFFRGLAGERFAVRNSGADAVVEGCGDHGCEYMTGGHVVVLGPTGRNFAAGMSGGIAYVLDLDPARCNQTLVGLEPLDAEDARLVHALVAEHVGRTGSTVQLDIDAARQGHPARVQAGAPAGRRPVRGGRVMADPKGFLEVERIEPPERDPRTRTKDHHEIFLTLEAGRAARAGAALHGLRRPVLPQRLPARQPHPGVERPRPPRRVAARAGPAARDEQLPRVHGADLPGAV